METHWDRSDYDAKVAEYNISVDGQGSELDKWLPANTSPGVRGGLNIAFGIAGGVLDGLFKSLVTSLPVVGIFANIAYGVKDIWEAHDAYKDVEGGRGTALYWVNIVRDVVDLVGGVVGSIDDTLTYAEDLCAASVVGAPIAAILAAIGEVASTIGLVCDGIKTTLDIASAIMNIMEANEAQREGDYRRAAKHRDLARGDVMDAIVDGIAFTAEAVSMITANAVPDDIVENVAEGTADMVQETTKTLGRKIGDSMLGLGRNSDGTLNGVTTAGKQIGKWNSAGQAVGGAFQSYNNVMYNIGLGDAMLYSPEGAFGGHVIEPSSLSGSGQASGMLSAAREQTVTQFQDAWGQLEGDNPKWYQKLINDILNPPEGSALDTYKQMLSPSAWISTAFSGFRHAAILLGDSGIEAIAGTLRTAAGLIQTVAEPAIETVNSWIAEMEPALDAMLENMAGALEKQTASLEWLRGTVDGVQEFLEVVNQLADQGGAIDQGAESLISSVEGLQIDGDDLGIPSWVPDWTYDWLFDGINSVISGITGEARELKSSALGGIDSFVEDRTSWAQEQLAAIEEAIAEGGELETMLQEGVESFTQTLADFARIVADWDMTIELDLPGTVTYLEGLATALNDATHESRTEEFHEFLRTEGQSLVDQWKAEHTDDVNQAYYPTVPEHEVAAVQGAWQLVDARLTELEAGQGGPEAWAGMRSQAQAAYDAAMAQAGQQGQGAITSFWSAADTLARFAAGLGL
ncbi:hypothetical protein L6R53_20415 [Myxococcota bacterium]|nr:hypothetical protein [Myxococcota bacterium]